MTAGGLLFEEDLLASAGSARSLLMTVLGEFVYPGTGQAWTGTLVEAMGALGVEAKSARQALARTARDGLLDSTRHGRRVQWRLSPTADDLLRKGTERIYGFLRNTRDWDGRWLLVSVAVPESQRPLRHRLRTRLSWLGMGSPSPGLWVVPDAGKVEAARDVITELGLERRAFAWTGPAVTGGHTRRLLDSAWDLDDVAARYEQFIKVTERLDPRSPREFFVSQVLLIQQWRRFPFIDPDLPPELLETSWPGARAAATFHDRRARWHRAAQAEWDRMDTEAGSRT